MDRHPDLKIYNNNTSMNIDDIYFMLKKLIRNCNKMLLSEKNLLNNTELRGFLHNFKKNQIDRIYYFQTNFHFNYDDDDDVNSNSVYLIARLNYKDYFLFIQIDEYYDEMYIFKDVNIFMKFCLMEDDGAWWPIIYQSLKEDGITVNLNDEVLCMLSNYKKNV